MRLVLPMLLCLTGCLADPAPVQTKAALPARIEVMIPPKREEIAPKPARPVAPSYYQSLDTRLQKLQGQLDWVQKRTIEK
jgi:hypothetical protein